MRSVALSVGRGERIRWLASRHTVAGRRDFGGRKGALIFLPLGAPDEAALAYVC